MEGQLINEPLSIYEDQFPFTIKSRPCINEESAYISFWHEAEQMLPWIKGHKYWHRPPTLFRGRTYGKTLYYQVDAEGYAVRDQLLTTKEIEIERYKRP